MERGERIGRLVEAKYWELDAIKRASRYEEKLKACAYVHHRDDYAESEVPRIKTYDSNPKSYLTKYENGFCGYLMPEDSEWARLVPRGSGTKRAVFSSEKKDREDLEGITALVFQCMTDSNFYSTVLRVCTDRDVSGTGYMYVVDGWDSGESGIIYSCMDPQESVLADDSRGICNVYIRRMMKSAIDVIRDYGAERLPTVEKRLAGMQSEDRDVEIFEAVIPREYLYDPSEREFVELAGGKKFAHLVYIPVDRAMVVESGYDVMPVCVDRRMSDSEKAPYGRGLIEDCLEEIIKLNDMSNMRQIIVQKNARPPMYVPSSLKGRYSGKPDAINYGPAADSTSRPTPILTSIDSNGLLADIEGLKTTLRNLIPVDLFETLMGSTDSRKTATEVSMRKNEAMILLAMSIGDMKRNLIEPVFKRSAQIIIKHLELGNEKERVRLQRLVDSSRLELSSVFIRRLNAWLQNEGDDQIVGAMQLLAQFHPQALDMIDMDAFMTKYMLGKGMSNTLIKDMRQVEAERNARAQIQNAQLQAQTGQMNAKANADNAKAMNLLGGNGGV